MLEKLRQEVWESNMLLPNYNLVVMTSGNVSGRDPETNLVVIKPSGFSYEKLTPQDLVIMDLDGKVVEGRLAPSVDTETHLYIYRNRLDVNGVTHTHSTYASVFGILGRSIPACLTATGMLGGEIPIGNYVPIGGKEIGEEVVKKIGEKLAIIMQNHGVFTIGDSATQSAKMAVEVENIAKITYFGLLLGSPILLSQERIDHVANIYHNIYGQHEKN
jgi:L-ribulose-5-phosphate 4-epimerase